MQAARGMGRRWGWAAVAMLAAGVSQAGAQFTGPQAPSSATPRATSSSSAQAATLPNAPSAIYAQRFIVNGRPYRKPTAHEDVIAYTHELISPRAFLSAAIRSGIEEARDVPTGWGQDFPGYAQRFGSAFGEQAIDSSVRYGLAGVLHEDVRYLVCHDCSGGAKVANALLAEVTARHGQDGHRTFSPTPIIAGFSGPIVAYEAWYPPGYDVQDAMRHASLNFGVHILIHMLREFTDKDPKAGVP